MARSIFWILLVFSCDLQEINGWSTSPQLSRGFDSIHGRVRPIHSFAPIAKSQMMSYATSSLLARTRQLRDKDDDDDDYYGDDSDADLDWNDRSRSRRRDTNWDEDEELVDGYDDPDRDNNMNGKPGAYNVHFSGESAYDEDEDLIRWELCDDGSTWVLLPPPYVAIPTAVIHFVGGTFFGSSPKLWYRTLLEGIVRATKCTVVATSIPVTLLKNPLRHVSLSRKLQRQFKSAWINVLADEYDEELLEEVPVVGIGHSLGARLLTVLATLSDGPSSSTNAFSRMMNMVPSYKSYILISFNNFGASNSVPGIQSLLKQSQSVEDATTERRRASPGVDGQRQREREQKRRKRRRRQQDYNDDGDDNDWVGWDEEDDEEWEEIVDEIQDAVSAQASRVKSALTPRSKELEFQPDPEQLWEALKDKDEIRYSIPQTLVIQFFDDEVDQSPRLADCLVQTNSSDVKYALLRGNHLTPISAQGEQSWAGQWAFQLPTEASKAMSYLIQGISSSSRSSKRSTSSAMRDLRQSVARYITDVVTN